MKLCLEERSEAPLGGIMSGEHASAIIPRRVHFDWREVPMHWLPGEPLVSQILNVTHLILPPGEKWFVRVCADNLAKVRDDALVARVRGFMGQEAIHGRSHASYLERLCACGIDPSTEVAALENYIRALERVGRLFGKTWFEFGRLSIVAATEHFTCVLGTWALECRALRRGEPMMLDLLLWHAAEEVEHRSVAFDLAAEISGHGLGWRIVGLLGAGCSLFYWWWRMARFLARSDPSLKNQGFSVRAYLRAERRGLLPGAVLLGAIFS
jgi:uncharacterized protein